MQKLLLILLLVGVLIYFISRKLQAVGKSLAVQKQAKQGYILIDAGSQVVNKVIKNTLFSVGIGVVLLVITLVLAMKVKILLIMLPISLYLIGQLFLLNNQLKYTKDQQIWYNPANNDVLVEWLSGQKVQFNLLRDIQQIRTVKAVQKNNQVQFGYYEIIVHNNQLFLPLIIEENQINNRFFKTLKDNYSIKGKTTLFPLI